jgi:hypothetical protein
VPDTLAKPADVPPVRIVLDDDLQSWRVDHPDQSAGLAHLLKTLATTDFDFANGIANQLIYMGLRKGSFNEHEPNFLLSIIRGVAPRDPVETVLAAQMAAVHNAIMKLGDTLDKTSCEAQERMFNRLARTFVTQMEALKRHRSGREQNVTVQNVMVRDGGQAVVGGNVNEAARDPVADLAATASPPVAPRHPTAMPDIADGDDDKVPVAAKTKVGKKQ